MYYRLLWLNKGINCSDTLLPCDCCYVTAEHYKPSSKRSETSSSFAKVTLVLSLGSSLCFFVVSRDDLLLLSISSVSYLQTSWLSRYLLAGLIDSARHLRNSFCASSIFTTDLILFLFFIITSRSSVSSVGLLSAANGSGAASAYRACSHSLTLQRKSEIDKVAINYNLSTPSETFSSTRLRERDSVFY